MKFQILILVACLALVLVPQESSCRDDQQEDDTNEVEKSPMPVIEISGDKCGNDECLMVGMQAYSEPRCVPLGKNGDFCRHLSAADNLTLHYPHKIVEATNIYTLLCPCSEGLTCVGATCEPE